MARRPVRFVRPGLGEHAFVVLTLIMLAYGIPSTWFTVDNRDVPQGDVTAIIVFIGLFAIAATRLAGNGRHIVRAVRREPLLLGFILMAVASTLWSTDPGTTIRRAVAMLLTTFFAYYLVVRFRLRDIIRLLAITFAIGTVLNIVWIVALKKYGITQTTISNAESGDWSGIFTHKNALGRSCLTGSLTYLFAARSFPRWRVVCYALAVANAVLIVGAHSRTAQISLILLVLLMVVYTGLRAQRTLFGGVAVALVGTAVIAGAFVTTNLGPITEALGRDVTLTGRTQLWSDVVHEIGKRPIVGYGWSGFFTDDPLGPSRPVLEHNRWNPPDAHNAVLQYLLDLGIIGTTLFVVAFLRALPRAMRYVRNTKGVLGLWPLCYLSLVLLLSITERGVATRDVQWVLFVIAVVVVGHDPGRRPRAPVRRTPQETWPE
ncbi:MAG TPA: O-antigen ligase, partial [Acidimicrobiales bacterium]|nr:O-antigen ligase [Acidimicrobiales bacterium]